MEHAVLCVCVCVCVCMCACVRTHSMMNIVILQLYLIQFLYVFIIIYVIGVYGQAPLSEKLWVNVSLKPSLCVGRYVCEILLFFILQFNSVLSLTVYSL
jgi:hypothetical protein